MGCKTWRQTDRRPGIAGVVCVAIQSLRAQITGVVTRRALFVLNGGRKGRGARAVVGTGCVAHLD